MQQEKAIETLKHLGLACAALAEHLSGTQVVIKHETAAVIPMPESKPVKEAKKEKPAKAAKSEEPKSEPEQVEEPKEVLPEITEDQLRTALVNFAQKNSKDKAYAVLGKYGAKKVNELKRGDFPKVLAELQ